MDDFPIAPRPHAGIRMHDDNMDPLRPAPKPDAEVKFVKDRIQQALVKALEPPSVPVNGFIVQMLQQVAAAMGVPAHILRGEHRVPDGGRVGTIEAAARSRIDSADATAYQGAGVQHWRGAKGITKKEFYEQYMCAPPDVSRDDHRSVANALQAAMARPNASISFNRPGESTPGPFCESTAMCLPEGNQPSRFVVHVGGRAPLVFSYQQQSTGGFTWCAMNNQSVHVCVARSPAALCADIAFTILRFLAQQS